MGTLRRVTLITETQMKFARTCIALVAIIAPCSWSGQATQQPRQSEIDSADRLFHAGNFPQVANFTRRSLLKIPKTIRQHSNWVVLRCFLTGLMMRGNGWKRP